MISRRLISAIALSAFPAFAVMNTGKDAGDKFASVDINTTQSKKPPRFAPGEIIVKVKAASMPPKAQGASLSADAELSSALPGFGKFKQRHAAERIDRLFQGNISATSAPKHPGRPRPANLYKIVLEDKKADAAAAARELSADPSVEYAEPNYISEIQVVPTDPLYPQQWAHKVTSAEPAWDITRGSASIIVAVVDVGVDYTHEDLAANIAPGGGDVVDIDVNQYIADGYVTEAGEDYTTPDNDPMDFNGHGTHCAGIVAAAADNGKGVSGVAPRVKILPVRAGFEIMSGGNRFGLLENDDIAAGIIYATDHGADVISMSFGSPDDNSTLDDAIAYARSHGVVLVAAAGNSALALPFYPAALPGVIAVAATNANNDPAYYSNRGYWVALAAPGGDQFHDPQILSTVPKTGGALTDPSGYRSISGTSMACPYAAGVAALILSKNPAWTPDNVAAIMKRSVDPVGGPFYIGAGRINILKALQAASAPNTVISIAAPANGAVFQGGTVDVRGSVGGGATNSYSVAWGAGVYPTAWTTIATGTAPVANGLLGSVNVTGFAPGTYTLRVTGFENGDHLDEFTRIQIDPALHTGWPQTVGLFGGTGFQTGFAQAPAIADVDGDGKADLLVLSNTNLYGFKHDGTALAGYPKANPQGSTTGQTQSAAVADLDGDGKPETVVSFEDGIAAYNSAGAQIFQTAFPFPLKNWLLQPMLVDLDGDGKKEILQKTWNNSDPAAAGIVVLTSAGAPFRSWPALIGSQYAADLRFAMTAAVDLDNDGHKEVITMQFNTATNHPALFIWNYDGTLRAGYPMDLTALGPGDNPQYGPFVADIDNDGRYEIGFLRNIGGCGTNAGQFTYVHTDGSAVAGWPAAFSDQIAGEAVSIADIDGDGKAETVFGSVGGGACNPDFQYAVNVLRSDGTPMPNWPRRLPLGQAYAQTALADITGDGKPKIIVGTNKGAVYAWSSDGTPVPGFPKNLGVIAAEEEGVKSCPAFGDIDGDGKLEMAATGIDGRVFVWDIDAAPGTAANEWRMYQGDAAHTGFRKAAGANASLAFEAENLARTASAVGSSVAVNQTGASNLAFVQINSGSAVGDWIQFTLPNLSAATYNLKVYYKSNANRATVRATVDGANQGSVFDEYAATAAQQVSFNLGSKALAAGNHTLRFTITGKNASSSGYTMTIDKIVLKPVTPLVFETENLARNSNVTTAVESDVNFSGGKSVKVNSSAVGHYVGFTLPSIPAGVFDVQVYYKSANNRPKAQARIDGTVQGATADMYSSATAYKVPFDFGNKTFSSAANHDLRLTVTSKNSSSSGYVMHIDKIVLVPQQ